MESLQRNRLYLIVSFSIIFGWVMSLPYEGPVLYAFSSIKQFDGVSLNMITVFCHFVGLFMGRFITKNSKDAKRLIQIKLIATIVVSALLPFVSGSLWRILVPMAALLTGFIIASYGHFIVAFVPMKMNLTAMADLLIYGNVVLISAHIFANNTTALISFIWIEALLLGALILVSRIDVNVTTGEIIEEKEKIPLREYWIFFFFIFLITLNSGLMFQVIYPYFSEFVLLQSLYTNVPYIAAIYLLSRVIKINHFYFLYAGLVLWAVTFLVFTLVDSTAMGFMIVCTIMLTACGVFDLFWWSVMANNLRRVNRPNSFMGMGLATNVFGVWVGGILGNAILSLGGDKEALAIVGLFIIIISMVVMFALNVKLSRLLIYSEFMFKLEEKHAEKENVLETIKEVLSNREYEVFYLLLMGRTDTEISEKLNISKNTIKTHNRNIYRKLEVSNRVQLIEKYQH